jgi:putative transposase
VQGNVSALLGELLEELTPLVGTRPACRALGVAPATIYRRRRPVQRPSEPQPRPRPARSLSLPEQEAVLDVLRSERFVDSSPAQVWATLLDEGRYLCSERTMYRLLAEHLTHRHSGIGLMTPAAVHYGRAGALHAERGGS